MIRQVLLWPDTKLKQKSAPVNFFEGPGNHFNTDALKRLVLDMEQTMTALRGVGISAIQVGHAQQLFLVKRPHPFADACDVFVNPKIIERSPNTLLVNEGCLSLPGIVETVKRHAWVDYQALDWDGKFKTGRLEGGQSSMCHIFQHEFDHLDGVVFPDRMDRGARDRIRAKMRKR